VEIWLLGSAELKALQTQRPVGSEVLFMPRVETSDGIQSELFTGSAFSLPLSTANAGFLIDLLPHVRKNSIDLIALASLTEARTNQPASAASVGTVSIWTNLAVAVRVQLTNGGSVFILDGPRGADPKRTGLVITAGLPLARK